jgi:DNA polymerase-3 subunit gamma/tau
MLSQNAWNAFLKTLEEPPPNTVFVLATTEANKVLPTVADRCHRFDFRRPSVEQLSQAVRRAADAEDIEIGDDAVTMIARSATGSFRDALGTLEQLVTYGGKSVQAEDVQAVLGVADFELLFAVADALAAGDRGAALRAVAELADTGRDMTAFARDLAVHIRNLLVARTLEEAPPGAGLTDEQGSRLIEQSSRFGPERTAHVLDLLSQMIQVSRAGGDPRLQLELALFKAARPEDDSDPTALIARIEALESRPAGAAPSAAVPKPAPAPVPVEATPVEDLPEPEIERTAETAEQAPPIVEEVPAVEPAVEAAGDPPSIEVVIASWPAAIASLGEVSPRLSTVLETARPIRVDGRMLILGFPASAGFVRKTAEKPESRDQLAEHIASAAGFNFALLTEELDDSEFEPVGGSDAAAGIDKDELIAQLKDKFDATEMAQPRPE